MTPFVYIASLPRTGSTLLSEVLTHSDYCFIHCEPCVGAGFYHWGNLDTLPNDWALKDYLLHARDRTTKSYIDGCNTIGARDLDIVSIYKNQFVVPMLNRVKYFGIKEIKNQNWRSVLSNFSEKRVILTARHPLAIVASLLNMRTHFQDLIDWEWHELSLNAILDRLLLEFEYQTQIANSVDCLRVKYEDLCSDTKTYDQICLYAFGETRPLGEVGRFISGMSRRRWEAELHRGKIGSASVRRGAGGDMSKRERELVCDRMASYMRFYGY